MTLSHAYDHPLGDTLPPLSDAAPPIPGRSTLLTHLRDAGSALRSVIRAARRDPEPGAIRAAAEGLEREGAVVFANVAGWPRPPAIRGFVPDVYALFEDGEVVLAFDGDASAPRDVAARRDAAFAAWAAASSRREHERIVVRGGRGGRG